MVWPEKNWSRANKVISKYFNMPRIVIVFLLLVAWAVPSFSQKEPMAKPLPEICLSPAEEALYKQVNEYRAQKGLPEIKLSYSLCVVAITHCHDQAANYKQGRSCNLHSWSDQGNWKPVCYTPDHRKAALMWSKPRELTNYPGDGYEISFYSNYAYPTAEAAAADILNGWKKSQGHNNVIINRAIWKNVEWQAMGVGIFGGYANVWFGKEKDDAPQPITCPGETK